MGDNTYKKLRIICLLLAIICMVLSLVKRAKAENMDPVLVDKFYQDNIYLASNISQVPVLYNLAQDGFCNFSYFDYTESGNNYRIYYICKGNIFLPGSINTSNNTFSPMIGWYGDRESYFVGGIDRSTWENIGQGNTALYCVKMQIASSSYSIVSCFGMSYSSGYDGTIANKTSNVYYNGSNIGQLSYNGPRTSNSYNWGTVSSPNYINCSDIYTNQTTYCRSYSNSSDLIKVDNIIDLAALYPDRNTEGFNIYKYGISGNERLVCDFSRTDITSFSPATAEASTIDLVIDINGTEYSYSFDSNDSFYQYSKNDRIALYSFPFYELGIDENTISAKLISCEVNNTVSSPGGSTTKKAVWVTPLLLFGKSFVPDSVDYDFSDYDNAMNTVTNFYQVYNSNEFLLSSSNFDLNSVPSWASKAMIYLVPEEPYPSKTYHTDIFHDQNNEYMLYMNGNEYNVRVNVDSPLQDFANIAIAPHDLIYSLLNYYDYVQVFYIEWDIDYPVLDECTGRIISSDIYFSKMYYQKLSIYADNGVQEAIEAQSDLLKEQITILYKYFGNIDSNLSKILPMGDLLIDLNNIDSNILRVLNQILDRLRNLNISEPDYTIITDKLDDIIALLQNSSYSSSERYVNYANWLFLKDTTDDKITPYEWADLAFDDVKGLYYWVTGGNDTTLNKIFYGSSQYISFLNGDSGFGSLTKYTNAIFDGSYDPHEISGIGGN